MKKNILLIAATALLLCSCSSVYYQIATIGSEKGQLNKSDNLVFNEGDYVIIYDFWALAGTVSFTFFNNSDKDVYIDMTKSFLLVNGMTNDYYKNRVWTTSSGYTRSTGKSSSIGFSSSVGASASAAVSEELYSYPGIYGSVGRSYSASNSASANNVVASSSAVSSSSSIEVREKEGVWVPAKASRHFAEFSMMNSPYRRCSFNRFPLRTSSLSFDETDTPYHYTNTLTIVSDGIEKKVETSFYIKNLMNAAESEIVRYVTPTDCAGRMVGYRKPTITVGGANKFYLRYYDDGLGDDRVKGGNDDSSASTEKNFTVTSSEGIYQLVSITEPTISYNFTIVEIQSSYVYPGKRKSRYTPTGESSNAAAILGKANISFARQSPLRLSSTLRGKSRDALKWNSLSDDVA